MLRCGVLCSLLATGLLSLALSPYPAAAQIHDLGETPWSALVDSTSRGGADFTWERGLGGASRWRTDRLSCMVRFPVGGRAMAYLRGSYVRLDTGDSPVLTRWPSSLAEEPEIDANTWPGETMLADFGQPEVGLLSPLSLPFLGAGDSALEVMFPFGKDETYPVSSRALAMRLEWRRRELALGPVVLGARVGWELSLDASGEVFSGEAFPDGPRFGLTVGTPLAALRGWTVGWAARELSDGHHSRRAEANIWTNFAGEHRVRAVVVRELGRRLHRTTDWRLGIALELRRSAFADEDQRKMPSPAADDPPAPPVPQRSP